MAHLKLQTTGYVLTEAAVLLKEVTVQYNPQLLSVKALYILLDIGHGHLIGTGTC